MGILKKIAKFFVAKKEAELNSSLNKRMQTSAVNATSKTVVSSGYTMTLDSVTQQNIKNVYEIVEKMAKDFDYNPIKLLNYAISKGTKVFKFKGAIKQLEKLRQEEGFIPPLEGMDAFFLNLAVKNEFGFKTPPMFVLEDHKIATMYILHQFYKWMSFYQGLPGFDMISQKLFRQSLYSSINVKALNLSELTGLQEAIKRDQEATDFTIKLVKQFEAAKEMKNNGNTEA